ncbi:acetyltransferase [Herbaspirillum robiniae]|uniref:acetyltransferase n=1 Tax=Herbaspirillum robiniae TaxID=2014887 RepID=UPI003D76E9FB
MLISLLYVLGAGGHAKVVVDALAESGTDLSRIRIRDDALERAGAWIEGLTVETPAIQTALTGGLFHLAIGNAIVRERMFEKLTAINARALTIVHPASTVSRHAKLGDGVFMAARSIIAPSASLGRCVIVNHGAIIDHDCLVGDFSHIAPNATLAGEVKIGSRVLIGAGANILPGIQIGDDVIVGAGSVVTRNISAGQVVVGIPAKQSEGKRT